MARTLSSFSLISTYISNQMLLKTSFTYQVQLLCDSTIDAVVKFYHEDGISRTSFNSKDTIKIDGRPVAVRFLEMTVLDAYHIFNE